MLSSVWKWFTGIWSRFKESIAQLYSKGILKSVMEERWVKAVIDISLVTMWTLSVIWWPYNYIVNTLAVAVIVIILSRTLVPREQSLMGDLLYPFVATALFSFGLLLYWKIAEVAIIAGILVIPALTNEVEERYISYERELTPRVA